MSTIKAIQTHYKGYHFRSRLEARWAVFFDALGIEWLYEHEGYDLGEAGWYLPDFWLPGLRCWVEVKGAKASHAEKKKVWELASSTQEVALLVEGLPGRKSFIYGAWCETNRSGGGVGCNEDYIHADGAIPPFICEDRHGDIRLVFPACADPDLHVRYGEDWDVHPDCNVWMDEEWYMHQERVDGAYSAAKSARFEHGETPHV